MRNIDETIDMLSEYDELDEYAKMYLFDYLVEIMQDLHKSEVQEGRHYESFMVLVDANGDIPQPFTKMKFQGALTDEVYEIDVKMIAGIARHENGNLTVTVIGKRTKIKQAVTQ